MIAKSLFTKHLKGELIPVIPCTYPRHITRSNSWMPRDILACQIGEAAIAVSKETLSLMCFWGTGIGKKPLVFVCFCQVGQPWNFEQANCHNSRIQDSFHQKKTNMVQKRRQGNAVPLQKSKRLRTADFLVASIAWQIICGTSPNIYNEKKKYISQTNAFSTPKSHYNQGIPMSLAQVKVPHLLLLERLSDCLMNQYESWISWPLMPKTAKIQIISTLSSCNVFILGKVFLFKKNTIWITGSNLLDLNSQLFAGKLSSQE